MTDKVKRYLRQAGKNVEVAEHLSTTKKYQWGVVCLFYAGLHYVNAYLYYTTQQVPENHGPRLAAVRQRMSSVYDEYRALKDQSERARYNMKYHKVGEFRRLQAELETIRRFVIGNLPTTGTTQ